MNLKAALKSEIAHCVDRLQQPNWSIDSYRCYYEGRMALAKELLSQQPKEKVIDLNITPQTHIRSTQGDSLLFRIPQDQLRQDGFLRKRRLERYNQYKMDLIEEAAEKAYKMTDEITVLFCIPVPPSWRGRKKARHHFTAHRSKPDVDNLCKAFMDALKPTKDHVVHTLIAKKIWVDFPIGWIRTGPWPDYLPANVPETIVTI